MTGRPFDQEMAERWHLYKPPARPSAGDVAIYESFMAEPAQTLLLGSTPEIRSLARRFGHRLTAVDMNEQVYHALEGLVTHPGDGKTRFVCLDWLQMDLGETFELVVGDGSINMLPSRTHERFLERLAAHTSPGATLLLRAYLMDEPRFATAEAVFERARETGQDLYTATKIHLSLLWLDQETGEMSNALFWKRLQELHREGVTTAEEHRSLEQIFAQDALSVYFLNRPRFEAQMAPYFSLQDIRCAGDYESNELKPIFCLRRR